MSLQKKTKFTFSIDNILEINPTNEETSTSAVESNHISHESEWIRNNKYDSIPSTLHSLNNMFEHSSTLQNIFNIQSAFSTYFSQLDKYNLQTDIKGKHHNLTICCSGAPGFYISEISTKRKGGQTRFTSHQTKHLENCFINAKYLSPEERKHLADQLKLSDRQVKTWFQNRRAKWRRQCLSKTSTSEEQTEKS